MAMTILAGSQSRINGILMAGLLQYPIEILRQEVLAEFNVFYHFNGVLMAN